MFNTYDSTRPYDNQMGYPENVLDRFWSKVKFEYNEDGTINNDACMIWTAAKHIDSYGQFWVNGKDIPSHRFSLSCYIGPLPTWEAPDWMCVRHKNFCNNKDCVNPLHLELGTNQQNTDDMIELGNHPRGSSHGMSVFKDEEVLEVIELSKSGMLYQEIADIFGVTRGAISKIVIGRTWSELTGIIHKPTDGKGINKATAILNNDKIREIRQKLKLSRTGASLAREYGVSPGVISKIKLNKIWTHVI
ncbi:MAG: hypothetical protein HOK80_01040 [Candidatus Cloacimonetes bacterium]|nr:hypothetical protein [Candidatus Cloacimonadota bacterium]